MKTICIIGISDKSGKAPFDSSTNSGKIIDQIISKVDANFIKMNYVSFAPLDEFGNLRYPTKEELNASFFSFQERILKLNPDVLVVCGKMIAKELKKHHFYQDQILEISHPSYIWVYKRKLLNDYIQDVVMKLNNFK